MITLPFFIFPGNFTHSLKRQCKDDLLFLREENILILLCCGKNHFFAFFFLVGKSMFGPSFACVAHFYFWEISGFEPRVQSAGIASKRATNCYQLIHPSPICFPSFLFIFLAGTVECVGHSFANVAHFYIFERCLDSNPECRRANNLATFLPEFLGSALAKPMHHWGCAIVGNRLLYNYRTDTL